MEYEPVAPGDDDQYINDIVKGVKGERKNSMLGLSMQSDNPYDILFCMGLMIGSGDVIDKTAAINSVRHLYVDFDEVDSPALRCMLNFISCTDCDRKVKMNALDAMDSVNHFLEKRNKLNIEPET